MELVLLTLRNFRRLYPYNANYMGVIKSDVINR